ncbi:MAG TPA: CPBP family intramembrane metalloprotease, partial [Acidobacteriota bacterium]|nr:CPBP family intramembrane metalloprotease [Acidobacteriota bacterium]
GLRSRFSQWTTIGIVSFLFLLVHVPQYWGGWSGLILLGTLSLALTVIRAETKSILPGVYIHTLFNAAGALGILLAGQQK